MRRSRDQQALSYPIRLPDEVQANALRLLDVSREVINQVIVTLWSQLDAFGERNTVYAYKQVESMIAPPVFHGSRLWRCQAEQAGRILRGKPSGKSSLSSFFPSLNKA